VLSDISSAPENAIITINQLEDIARISNKKVALKVDTGMHRSGIEVDDMEDALGLIEEHGLSLHSVFTHFRAADELSCDFFWQTKQFEKIKDIIKRHCADKACPVPLFHTANSAALLRLGKLEDDFARVGIAAYGYDETQDVFNTPLLKPVLSLWGEKVASRMVKKGQRLGYGGVYTCEYDMMVSSYDVGYGDGFFRYDGKGDFYPNSDIKPLGRISMDSMSVEGDRDCICVFKDVENTSKRFDTITYDALVKLSPQIKRKIK